MEYDQSPYEIINLGNDRTEGLLEMVRTLEEAFGVRARMKFLPPQPGDVPQTWADIDKVGRLLGYRPRTAFEEGVRRFIEWIRADSDVVRALGPGPES